MDRHNKKALLLAIQTAIGVHPEINKRVGYAVRDYFRRRAAVVWDAPYIASLANQIGQVITLRFIQRILRAIIRVHDPDRGITKTNIVAMIRRSRDGESRELTQHEKQKLETGQGPIYWLTDPVGTIGDKNEDDDQEDEQED